MMSPSRLALIASLTLALSPALAPGQATAAEPVPLAAQGCVGCHGVRGTGSDPIPRLSGRPAAEIAMQMNAFASNQRPGTIMGRIARGYSEADIAAIAAYFAAQK